MNPKLREILKLLSIPLVLIIIYGTMAIIWWIFDLPTDTELVEVIRGWFATYGLWIVFVGALIEGFLLLGQYFPGGFIIFLGVISAGKDISRAMEVVLIVCIAFLISYSLNYFVGRYGWFNLFRKFGLMGSIEKSKEKLLKHGLNAIFMSYWEPNLASITATAAGILKVPFLKFSIVSTLGILVWNAFWGILVYVLGESALEIAGFKWVLTIFGVWVAVILLKKYWFDKWMMKRGERNMVK